MPWLRVVAACGLALIVGAFSSLAQCDVSPLNGGGNSVPVAGIFMNANYPPFIKNGVRAGMNKWNECNGHGNGGNAPDWPAFVEGGLSPSSISIQYVGGQQVDSRCAAYSPSADVIFIWDSVLESSSGTVIDCVGNPEALAQIIAHELGHYLGLADNFACDTAIMGPAIADANGNINPNGSITQMEKALVDAMNSNPQEDFVEDCEGDQGCGNQEGGSPIVLDLDRNGFQFSGLSNPVSFDIDGDREPEVMSWLAPGTHDGLLFRNRHLSSGVDSGVELFGNATRLLLTEERAAHGYEALAELDLEILGGNGNGYLDPDDVLFSTLGLWIDGNHDAVSQDGELYRLEELGIVRINYGHRTQSTLDLHGNDLRFWSSARAQMGDRLVPIPTVDVFFVLE